MMTVRVLLSCLLLNVGYAADLAPYVVSEAGPAGYGDGGSYSRSTAFVHSTAANRNIKFDIFFQNPGSSDYNFFMKSLLVDSASVEFEQDSKKFIAQTSSKLTWVMFPKQYSHTFNTTLTTTIQQDGTGCTGVGSGCGFTSVLFAETSNFGCPVQAGGGMVPDAECLRFQRLDISNLGQRRVSINWVGKMIGSSPSLEVKIGNQKKNMPTTGAYTGGASFTTKTKFEIVHSSKDISSGIFEFVPNNVMNTGLVHLAQRAERNSPVGFSHSQTGFMTCSGTTLAACKLTFHFLVLHPGTYRLQLQARKHSSGASATRVTVTLPQLVPVVQNPSFSITNTKAWHSAAGTALGSVGVYKVELQCTNCRVYQVYFDQVAEGAAANAEVARLNKCPAITVQRDVIASASCADPSAVSGRCDLSCPPLFTPEGNTRYMCDAWGAVTFSGGSAGSTVSDALRCIPTVTLEGARSITPTSGEVTLSWSNSSAGMTLLFSCVGTASCDYSQYFPRSVTRHTFTRFKPQQYLTVQVYAGQLRPSGTLPNIQVAANDFTKLPVNKAIEAIAAVDSTDVRTASVSSSDDRPVLKKQGSLPSTTYQFLATASGSYTLHLHAQGDSSTTVSATVNGQSVTCAAPPNSPGLGWVACSPAVSLSPVGQTRYPVEITFSDVLKLRHVFLGTAAPPTGTVPKSGVLKSCPGYAFQVSSEKDGSNPCGAAHAFDRPCKVKCTSGSSSSEADAASGLGTRVRCSPYQAVWLGAPILCTPDFVSDTPAQSGGLLLFEWASQGDSRISGFFLRYRPVNGGVFKEERLAKSATTFTISRLTVGTEYLLQLHWQSGTAVSARGTEKVLSTLPQLTPAIASPPVLMNVTGGAVAMHIPEPSDTGGAEPWHAFGVMSVYQAAAQHETKDAAARVLICEDTGTYCLAAGLTSNTRYYFAVFGTSQCGGDAGSAIDNVTVTRYLSTEQMFQTGPPSAPGMPRQPIPTGATGGAVTLQLLFPLDTGGLSITRLLIAVTNTANGDTMERAVAVAAADAAAGVVPPHSVNGLVRNTVYRFRVRAENAEGVSVASPPAEKKTQNEATRPTPPTIAVESSTGGAIRVCVVPGDTGGEAIETFAVHFSTDTVSEQPAYTQIYSGSVRCYTHGGLTANTQYVFAGEVSNGAWSSILTDTVKKVASTTAPTPPGRPVVNVTEVTGGAVTVEIIAFDTGGVPVTSYSLTQDGDAPLVVPSTASTLTYSFGCLSLGQSYDFTLGVANTLGGVLTHSPTAAVSATTLRQITPPGACRNLRLKGSPSKTYIQVEWDSPTDTGGTPIMVYHVRAQTTDVPNVGGEAAQVFNARANGAAPCSTSIVQGVGGLGNTNYRFTVRAYWNGDRLGDACTIDLRTGLNSTAPAPPDQPQLVSRGWKHLRLSWQAPVDVGADSIQGYDVRYIEASQQFSGAPFSTALSSCTTKSCEFVLGGGGGGAAALLPATSYAIVLWAKNSLGPSQDSKALVATTMAHEGQMEEPTVACMSGDSAWLVWEAPDLGASPSWAVQGYVVTRREVGGGGGGYTPFCETTSASALQCNSGGLTTSTPYTFRVSPKKAGSALNPSLPIGGNTTAVAHRKFCTYPTGDISPTPGDNVLEQWVLAPPLRPSDTLRLDFTAFDLECDYDWLQVYRNYTDPVLLWEGGCTRGAFVITNPTDVFLNYSSDVAITGAGFSLRYTVESLFDTTQLLLPQSLPGVEACPCVDSSRGWCDPNAPLARDVSSCVCRQPWWVGESCAGYDLSPSHAHSASSFAARDKSVVLVSPYGSDVRGNGWVGPAHTPGKPLKTLAKAVVEAKVLLAAGAPDVTILALPGQYKGSANTGLPLTGYGGGRLHLTSLRGMVGWGSPYTVGSSYLQVNESTTIDGEGSRSLLSVTAANASITGFTLTRGSGSAIHVAAAASLTLRNTRVTASTAGSGSGSATSGSGGGIKASDGSIVTLHESTITECSAASGGGVQLARGSRLQLRDASTVVANLAASGGGVAMGNDCVVSGEPGSAVTANRATVAGGNIVVTATGIATLSTLLVERGTAPQGGGVAVVPSAPPAAAATTFATLHLQGSSVSRNTATTAGGGVHLVQRAQLGSSFATPSSSSFPSSATHSTIGGNRVVGGTGEGGGIYMQPGTSVTSLPGALSVQANSAAYGGGFAVTSATAAASASTAPPSPSSWMAGPVFSGNNASTGGGGYVLASTLDIARSVLDRNTAALGGGLALGRRTRLSLSHATNISRNTASSGGGAWMSDCPLLSSDPRSAIRDNNAQEGGGVALVSPLSVPPLLQGVVVRGNSAERGAGLHAASVALTLTTVTLADNKAQQQGGGLFAHSSTVTLHATTQVKGNRADRVGGGIYASDSSLTTAASGSGTHTPISDNSAGRDGGGVALVNARAAELLTIRQCTASTGGGVHISGTSLGLSRSVVERNTGKAAGGGMAILGAPATVALRQLTLTGNSVDSSDGKGGNLFLQSVAVTHSSVVAREGSAYGGSNLYLSASSLQPAPQSPNTTLLLVSNIKSTAFSRTVGGNAQLAGSPFLLKQVTVDDGRASLGGGVYVSADAVGQLQAISLRDNYASERGGGLFADRRSDITLLEVQATGNEAIRRGGAIFLMGCAARFRSLLVLQNEANTGGGVTVDASSFLRMPSSGRATIDHNTAKDRGGGMSVAGLNFRVDGVAVTSNKGQAAGGVYSEPGASGEFVQAAIERNEAQAGDGGGLLLEGGAATTCGTDSFEELTVVTPAANDVKVVVFRHVTVQRNKAWRGGGMALDRAVVAEAHHVALWENTVTGTGGGIMASGRSQLTLHASRVSHNTAERSGGGVAALDAAEMAFHGSQLTENRAKYGAGGSVVTATLRFNESAVTRNRAGGKGGAFYVDSDGFLVVWGSQLTSNSAQDGGAALVTRVSEMRAYHSVVYDNRARNGGGALLVSDATLRLTATALLHNRAERENGGAVLVDGGAHCTLLNCSVVGNSADESGGAVAVIGASHLTINGGRYAGNVGKKGGAALISDDAVASVGNATFSGNSARSEGGALYCDLFSRVLLTACRFSSNAAPLRGGGAYFAMQTNRSAAVSDLRLFNNSAVVGGGIYWVYRGADRRLLCPRCVDEGGNAGGVLATNAVNVSIGWFPEPPHALIRNGITIEKLGVSPPVYLHLLLVDRYRQVNNLASDTVCQVRRNLALEADPTAEVVIDKGTVQASKGVLSFHKLTIKGTIGTNVSLLFDCGWTVFNKTVTVGECLPGQELSPNRQCVWCKPNYYSPDGHRCRLCPEGAECITYRMVMDKEDDEIKPTAVGSPLPVSIPGWWLYQAPQSKVEDCPDINWQPPNQEYEEQRELLSPTEMHYCEFHQSFYLCGGAAEEGCPGKVSTWRNTTQCGVGYEGIVCSLCSNGFYKQSDGSCGVCSASASDEALSKTWYALRITVMLALTCVGVAFYLRVRPPQPRSLAPQRTMQRKELIKRVLGLGGYEKLIRPEKFKIGLAFGQVFNNMQDVYPRVWPPQIRIYMREFASTNLDIIRISGFECLVKLNFYNTFTFFTTMPLITSAILLCLVWFGREMFNRQLLRLISKCPNCGKVPAVASLVKPVKPGSATAATAAAGGKGGLMKKLKGGGGAKTSPAARRGTLKVPDLATNHEGCTGKANPLKGEQRTTIVKANISQWRKRVLLRISARHYQNKCLKLFFWVLLLAYPAVSVNVLQLFRCNEVGADRFLDRDYGVSCNTVKWMVYSVFGVAAVLLYILGIPAMFFMLLYRARNHNIAQQWATTKANPVLLSKWVFEARQDAIRNHTAGLEPVTLEEKEVIVTDYMRRKNLRYHRTLARLGFIYVSYTEPRWWYEIVELARKLVLNGAVIFVHADSPSSQLVVGMAVCNFALVLCLFLHPYTRRSDYFVATLALGQLSLTMLCGDAILNKVQLIVVEDSERDISVLSTIVIGSNVLTILAFLLALGMEIVTGLKLIQENHAKELARSSSVLPDDGHDHTELDQLLLERSALRKKFASNPAKLVKLRMAQRIIVIEKRIDAMALAAQNGGTAPPGHTAADAVSSVFGASAAAAAHKNHVAHRKVRPAAAPPSSTAAAAAAAVAGSAAAAAGAGSGAGNVEILASAKSVPTASTAAAAGGAGAVVVAAAAASLESSGESKSDDVRDAHSTSPLLPDGSDSAAAAAADAAASSSARSSSAVSRHRSTKGGGFRKHTKHHSTSKRVHRGHSSRSSSSVVPSGGDKK